MRGREREERQREGRWEGSRYEEGIGGGHDQNISHTLMALSKN